MIGILLLFFIGKAFYELAKKHNRNKWIFAILGIGAYYLGVTLGGFLLGMIAVLFEWEAVFEIPEFALGLLLMPVGLFAVWILHYALKKNWTQNKIEPHSELLDN